MNEIALPNSPTEIRSACCHARSGDRARQGCRARASTDGFTASLLNGHGNVRQHRQSGFTLVEMVAVIVLLSFGLIAGSQLFRMTAESYRDTSTRMKLTQDGRFVIERISRELREALPGSVRTSISGTGTARIQCIEWLPVVAASRYLTLPTSTINHFTVMKITSGLPSGMLLFAAVFPLSDATIYSADPAVSPLRRLAATPVNAGGESSTSTDEIYLSAATTFATSSPSDRVFFTTSPVAICARDGNLLRYSNYGFAVPTTLTNGVLMAENVLGGVTDVFNVSGATLTRNAMVSLNIQIQDARTAEVLRLQHTVFIRNVP